MKKLLVRVLLVLVGVAGLTIPAKAQALVIMKIPFQFEAAGQTFPAGEYKITRLNDWDSRVLLLSSREIMSVSFCLPLRRKELLTTKRSLPLRR